VGVLLTIAASGVRESTEVEHRCDTVEEIVAVIRGYANLTLLFINCHSIDDQGHSDPSQRGRVSGIRLGGARIYAGNLAAFSQIQTSFSLLARTDPFVLGLVLAAPGNAYTPSGVPTLTDSGFNNNAHLFVPRIVMRSCSIGQNRDFCQRLADTTQTWVFAPQVDQWVGAAAPWSLHNQVLVFMPASFAQQQLSSIMRDRSPFQRRLGRQMISMRSGRGIGRVRQQSA
jgi:hypothetical protein